MLVRIDVPEKGVHAEYRICSACSASASTMVQLPCMLTFDLHAVDGLTCTCLVHWKLYLEWQIYGS